MERKNTDQNISPISVRICLNGYRLSFIRDSRHVIAYQYQKSHIRPSVALSLSLSLLNLSFFFLFIFSPNDSRFVEGDRAKRQERFSRNDRVYDENSLLSLRTRARSSNNQRSRGAHRWKNGRCTQGMRERRGKS